jgi:hypothetical protein
LKNPTNSLTSITTRLGPYENIDQLDATAAQLQKMGIKAIRLKVKKTEET